MAEIYIKGESIEYGSFLNYSYFVGKKRAVCQSTLRDAIVQGNPVTRIHKGTKCIEIYKADQKGWVRV